MSKNETVSLALVDNIYAAALGEHGWDIALQNLRQYTNTRMATLLAFDPSSSLASVNTAVGDDPNWSAACQHSYGKEYYLHDPGAPIIGKLQVGEWFEDSHFYSPEHKKKHIFYQEFMRPNELGSISGMFAYRDGNDHVFLSFLSGPESQGFSIQKRQHVRALGIHVHRALQIQVRLKQLELRAAIAESALDTLTVPVLLINEQRALRYANAAAERLITEEPAMRFMQGRFSATNCTDDNQWLDACNKGALLIQRANGGTLPLTLTPVPEQSLLTRLQHGRLTLMTTLDMRTPSARAQRLRVFYNLTAAEADLAVLLCYDGLSPQACADIRHVSIGTIRSQIKAIYNKTGVSTSVRLSQLVFQS